MSKPLVAFAEIQPRESEVIRLSCAGMAVKQIAAHLGITVPTAKSHLDHIYRKCDIDGRVTLVTSLWLYGGWIDRGELVLQPWLRQ